jgi:hypothetical protein
MLVETQAAEDIVHYHHVSLIWSLYLMGVLCHVALQIDDIARKNKWARKAVVEALWIRLVYRTFATAMIFGIIWHYPLLIPGALKAIGHPVSDDEATVLAIPMNNFIAGLYGSGLDSLLGYIPGLKSWLPDLS